jgi:hypothetical protein
MENTEENCEMIWKIWKKSKLKYEMIWKIQKKSKLNSEKIPDEDYFRNASCALNLISTFFIGGIT